MKQKVSLWLGNFASQEEFQEYFKITYKEDGNSVSSEFETDFHLSYYDRDLVEKIGLMFLKIILMFCLKDSHTMKRLLCSFLKYHQPIIQLF